MRRATRSSPEVIESIRSFPRRRHLVSDAARLLRASGASVPSNTQRFLARKNVCDFRVGDGREERRRAKRQVIETRGKRGRGSGGIEGGRRPTGAGLGRVGLTTARPRTRRDLTIGEE